MIAQPTPMKLLVASALCLLLSHRALFALGYPVGGLPGELAFVAEARAAEKQADWFKAAGLYGQLNRLNPAKGATETPASAAAGRFAARREDRNYQRYVEQLSIGEASRFSAMCFPGCSRPMSMLAP